MSTLYMEQAILEGADAVAQELDGRLTKEQVAALAAKERMLYGDGGDVARQLPRLRDDLEQEAYRRLLPGYTRHFIENAAPLVGIGFEGSLDGSFTFKPLEPPALDRLLPASAVRVHLHQERTTPTCRRTSARMSSLTRFSSVYQPS